MIYILFFVVWPLAIVGIVWGFHRLVIRQQGGDK